MKLNLAEEPGLGGALAPPAALLPGLALPQIVGTPYSLANTLQYGGLILIVSYIFMWLAVIPLLRATRQRIRWTAVRIVLLGTLLGAAPWLAALLWSFADDAVSFGVLRALERVPNYEWFAILWFAACGLFVGACFAAIQWLFLRGVRRPPAEAP